MRGHWKSHYKKSFWRGGENADFVQWNEMADFIDWNRGFFTKIHQVEKSCQSCRRFQVLEKRVIESSTMSTDSDGTASEKVDGNSHTSPQPLSPLKGEGDRRGGVGGAWCVPGDISIAGFCRVAATKIGLNSQVTAPFRAFWGFN